MPKDFISLRVKVEKCRVTGKQTLIPEFRNTLQVEIFQQDYVNDMMSPDLREKRRPLVPSPSEKSQHAIVRFRRDRFDILTSRFLTCLQVEPV